LRGSAEEEKIKSVGSVYQFCDLKKVSGLGLGLQAWFGKAAAED